MTEANSINAATTGIVGNTGTSFTGTAVTAHNIIVGGSTSSTLTNVAPSATSGVPVISQGASSDPIFGTAVVAGGGTGDTSFTAYAVICGGTTSTNPLQSIAGVGTSPQVLTSNGAGALPTFQAVSSSGAITTITGNTGGAESPSAGNFNILGTGSITIAGTANTETVQLTGLTNHNVLVGAGTATVTNVAPSATSGIPLVSNGSSSDPSFTTAVVAGGGTGATSFNTNGAVISGTSSTAALAAVALSSQKFLVGNSGAPTAKALSVNIQVFTSSGTYTPTSGMVYCIIEAVGGGGGGGGAATSAPSTGCSAGGGGGGGYSRLHASSATIGSSQSVTIGAAGTAGAAGNNTGGTGGTTSVGALISVTGGVGGGGSSAAATTSVGGGAGGVGSSGDFNTQGAPGGIGFGVNTLPLIVGGAGGNSFFGGGAPGVTGAGQAGNAATSYGGGGCGAITANSTQQAGGAGFAGIVVITEFVIS